MPHRRLRARPTSHRAGWFRAPLLGAFLLSALLLSALAATAQELPAPPVNAADALAAYDRFRASPEKNLQEAPTFLRFMQGGTAHTVLNNRLMFFMYRDVPPDVQAVLYASYMGANLDSQLRSRRQGDDPLAGMAAVLETYAALKQTHPDLVLEELESLRRDADARGLESAVQTMADGR